MRNWSAILIDAGLRKISATKLARELGVPGGAVSGACFRYGVRLPGVRTRRCRTTAAAKWAKRFAECGPGLTLNEFCRLHKCGAQSASQWAQRCAYSFAPSDARSP